jgi:hypothetical protein
MIAHLLDHFCARGVLTNPYNWEMRGEVYASVRDVESELANALNAVRADSPAHGPLLRMQNTSRSIIQNPSVFPQKENTPASPINGEIWKAINAYRAEFAIDMRELEQKYNLADRCHVVPDARVYPDSAEELLNSVTVSSDAGTSKVADFLSFLSAGPVVVTMNSSTAEELRSKKSTIQTQAVRDVSLKYALDRILIPQLPGPEKWTYQVEGRTVMIERGPQ